MIRRLWRLNVALALLTPLLALVPALANQANVPVLRELPSPVGDITRLPDTLGLPQSLREAPQTVKSWLVPETKARGRVIRVVDGDTVIVRSGQAKLRVRMIGVDTPESVKPGTPVQCYGKEASAATSAALLNKKVTLIYDVERTDRYERDLAYIERAGKDHGAWLLRRGYARTLEIAPNTRRAEKYARLERRAKRRAEGLWGACGGGR